MLPALSSALKGSLGTAAIIIAVATFFVIALYLGRDKGDPGLASILRQYASQRRYDLWVWTPGRFSFLSPADYLGTKFKLSGVKNGARFEVTFVVFQLSTGDNYEPETKSTHFSCVPTWLPDNSGVSITVGLPRTSWLYSNPEPSLSRYGLHVYVSPPELISAFEGPVADKLLEDFAKASSVSEINGTRRDSNSKYGLGAPDLYASITGWCDDPRVLDDTIDILTRFCRLR